MSNRLHDWTKAMKVVTRKPKLNVLYCVEDTLYIRHCIPEGEKNAGHQRWHRVRPVETIILYNQTNDNESPQQWIDRIKSQQGRIPFDHTKVVNKKCIDE